MDAKTKKQAAEYAKRLQEMRSEILNENPFYGLLLMRLSFALTNRVETCCVDGKKFYINPEYMDSLTDMGLMFVLLHELTHLVLKHPLRRLDAFEEEKQLFDSAADLVTNSTVLDSLGLQDLRPFVFSSDKIEHKAPDGVEAQKYSVEQILSMMLIDPQKGSSGGDSGQSDGGDEDPSGQSGDEGGDASSSEGDSDNGNESADGDEQGASSGNETSQSGSNSGGAYLRKDKPLDDHSTWPDNKDDAQSESIDWQQYAMDAAMASKHFGEKGCGNIPGSIRQMIEQIKNPKVDWRVVLHDFIQEEINDYSFSPPDKRYSESDFFLPDFNDTEAVIKDLYFYIDTSGSMSDDEVADLFSEIKGAIDQFNGKLKGKIGFFDAKATKPIPFEEKNDLSFDRIYGGGGTSFLPVFSAIMEDIEDNDVKPACLIIMTDGYAPFPEEDIAEDIPVLWAVNNEDITPPWGKVIRVLPEEDRHPTLTSLRSLLNGNKKGSA